MCPGWMPCSDSAGHDGRGFRNLRQEARIRSAEPAVVSRGTWRSPVAHCNGVAGVAGSNPAVPIEKERAHGPALSRSGRRDLAVAPRRGLGVSGQIPYGAGLCLSGRRDLAVAPRRGLGVSGQIPYGAGLCLSGRRDLAVAPRRGLGVSGSNPLRSRSLSFGTAGFSRRPSPGARGIRSNPLRSRSLSFGTAGFSRRPSRRGLGVSGQIPLARPRYKGARTQLTA